VRFSTGQVVVHPHHGPATIAGTFSRSIRGEEVHYLQLVIEHKDLELSLPAEKAEELGVRPLLTAVEVGQMFDRLTAETGHEESQWSRRVKHNVDRLNSGDAMIVAELVRDLTRRETDKGLSLGERDLLRDARRPVVHELSIVLGLPEPETVQVIEAAVLEGRRPDLSGLGGSGLATAS
jgi:CarD family transcriptional regulator